MRGGCRDGGGCLPQGDGQAIEIRAAAPSDAPAIGRIHVGSWRETYRGMLPDHLLDNLSAVVRAVMRQGALDPPVLLFVAQLASGELVGFAGGGPRRGNSPPHDAEVYAIYVLGAARHRGCGRRLLTALAAALRARGFKSLCLWVLRENAHARRFYEQLGGQVIGERTEVDGEQEFNEVAYGWASLESLCSIPIDLKDRH
jgi:ribosomal protein S18 acetylase RimI-like enzyme